ncbi:SulP family inorganic anion transporter [Paraburkholderia aromaticivorans]|uniref:SulP family inorganic anion transporter n=1 Tax=Paraburkholderia aromaticivorans TaxID=2026199 RepID=UPI001455FFA4|nr:SulP family inorganic anion transporter [Paraburkholderia aromaticivorans]
MNLREQFVSFPRDMFAGTVVFLVALPLCLGIANASGVDPFAGLLSGIIGGLVVALLSGSHLSVSGPAAGLVVIVVDGMTRLGSFPSFLMAVLLAGAMQFGFGLLKAGRFAAYVPSSVIKGMLAAIGLLLIIKQAPLAAGLANGSASGTTGTIVTPFGAMSVAACAIAIVSLAILASWETRAARRFALVRHVPAPLAVVLFGISVTLLLDFAAPGFAPPLEHRVSLPSLASFAALDQAFNWPELTHLLNPEVWRLAMTIAIVASLETLLSLEAVEQIDPKKRPVQPDRELKAQGIGNMVAGAIGGLPITSVIVRSSANVEAGAQSRWSAVVHGVLLLVSVFALTAVINLIPLASLATILIFTGLKLAKPSMFADAARQGLARFAPFVVTISAVLLTDLLMGIVLGIVCSIAFAIHAHMQRPITLAQHDDHFLLIFRKDVSFLAKVSLKEHLKAIPDGATVLLDGSRADFIDPDVREMIDEFLGNVPARGIHVECRQLGPIVEERVGLRGIGAFLRRQ